MENLIQFKTFDAVKTSNSIQFNVKSEGFRKKAIWYLVLGFVSFATAFLPLLLAYFIPEMSAGLRLFLFYLSYLKWVGLFLILAGTMILVRSTIMSKKPVIIDSSIRQIDLRGTVIPFSEVKSIVMNPGAMGLVSVVLAPQTGRKRMLLAVAVDDSEMSELEKLVAEVKLMVGV